MKTAEEWFKTEQVKFGASANSKSKNSAAERGNAYHRKIYKLLKMQQKIMPHLKGWELLVEPWYRGRETRKLRSPDTVFLNEAEKLALVIEVKLNWKDGKDEKLLCEYLPIVESAHGVKAYPCMVVQCLRGYTGEPLVGLAAVWQALKWNSTKATPVAMVL